LQSSKPEHRHISEVIDAQRAFRNHGCHA
jgi:hypothetical protein